MHMEVYLHIFLPLSLDGCECSGVYLVPRPLLNFLQTLGISSSGLLRSVRWSDTDVSGQPIDPIIKSQTVVISFFLCSLTLEDGSDG
jgi:hypothetical protein